MTRDLRFRSHVAMPEAQRAALCDALGVDLAAALDLAYQVKQAHWNVRGEQFFARHEMFDRLHAHLGAWADTIAERIGTLGGYAHGTVRLAAERTPLAEHDLLAVQGDEHVRSLVERYAAMSEILRQHITLAAEHEDPVTEDLFVEVLRGLELDLWFLESHLVRGAARTTEAQKPVAPKNGKRGRSAIAH